MKNDPLISIGTLANRVGISVSAIRFYADQNLIPSIRADSGHRWFSRSTIRRVSFILICQRLGYTLEQIRAVMLNLPDERTPTKRDWQKLSRQFERELDLRIRELEQLKTKLTGCIGCGCLSLQSCHLYNPQDAAAEQNVGGDLMFAGVQNGKADKA